MPSSYGPGSSYPGGNSLDLHTPHRAGQVTGAAGLSPSLASALAYITIVPAIIFLVLEPFNRDPLIRFHSMQSIALAVATAVLWTALTLLHFIPYFGIIFSIMQGMLALSVFILWVVVIIRAGRGEYYRLPIIGEFALEQSRHE